MFRGLYEHTIDEKGRISLPARIREIFAGELEDRLIITTHYSDPCLVVYPLTAWQTLETRLAEKPQFDKRMVRFKRLFVAPAIECTLDRHGRIIVPSVHRQHASLTRDTMWAGMVDFLELWDRETWYATRESYAEESEDDFRDLGI
jgi:MraZ protein